MTDTTHSTDDGRQHAVLVCSPGMGHLIPVLELAKRLSSLHSFKATIVFVTTQTQQAGVLPLPPNVDLLPVPAADISSLIDPAAQVVTKIFVLMRHTGPAVRAAIGSALSSRSPTVLVLDMFAAEYVSMGRDFRLPTFVYVPCSAWFLALSVYCPVLDKEVKGEYVDQAQPLKLPGCKPVRPDEVADPMMDRSDAQYAEYLQMGREIPMFDGVLLNTWAGLEPSTLAALRDADFIGKVIQAPVYEIGPVVRTVDQAAVNNNNNNNNYKLKREKILLEWLDQQPARSVMYVAFGSGGTLSTAQMAELAWGLELSKQRFVWVVRPAVDDGEASGSYLEGSAKGSNHDDAYAYAYNLPDGFIERIGEVGVLVPQWAPQLQILSHKSVGGFLTHCGWNSVMESITNGVPMIAWPMYAEQRMNARLLVEELEVAIEARELPEKRVVGREEIGEMVRRVMEGEEGDWMRTRAEGLRRSGIQALSDTGTSFNCLSQFVRSISTTTYTK